MSIWDTYPATYRQREVQVITTAVQAGDCISVVGLSGAGKSNLLGFITARTILPNPGPRFRLVDCNRLTGPDSQSFYQLIRSTLANEGALFAERSSQSILELELLEAAIQDALQGGNLCLLFDRFEGIAPLPGSDNVPLQSMQPNSIFSNLRALRDAHKYSLTYVTSTRRPLDPTSELAELFYGNRVWLGPLSEADALWSAARYAERKRLAWTEAEQRTLVTISWGYPAFLRAACEAYADGAELDSEVIKAHSAVQRRVAEFWNDKPSLADLANSGLKGHPFLAGNLEALFQETALTEGDTRTILESNSAVLTAKEHLLLAYLQAHPNQVCEKDTLIQAVWPEDRVLLTGLRDDSLAQLVRRLRKKIEPNPSSPRYLHTIPGRGYRFTPT